MNRRRIQSIETEKEVGSAFADATENVLDGDNKHNDEEYEEWMGREDH